MENVKRDSKRAFFEVKAPMTSTGISLYGSSKEALNGRVIKLDLTRSLRGKNLELRMKVVLNEGVLVAEPIGMELISSYIRKMIRKGTDYVEDSFEVDCKDAKVLVKPFMITRNKVSRAVRNDLRKTTKTFLQSYLQIRNAKEAFSDILANKVQKELSLKLKKVYPLALCEIRVFKLVGKQ